MKAFITLMCIMLSIFVAIPFLLFGFLGLNGVLADVSVAENARIGRYFLIISGAVLTFTAYWFVWVIRRPNARK